MPDLGLQTQAEQHFGYLVAETDYRCTETNPYRVRFDSTTAFIELVFDPRRGWKQGARVDVSMTSPQKLKFVILCTALPDGEPRWKIIELYKIEWGVKKIAQPTQDGGLSSAFADYVI